MNIDLSKLRELREKAGLTRRDLADKIDCREHTIIRWENGENKKPLSPITISKRIRKVLFGNVNEIKNTFKYSGLYFYCLNNLLYIRFIIGRCKIIKIR